MPKPKLLLEEAAESSKHNIAGSITMVGRRFLQQEFRNKALSDLDHGVGWNFTVKTSLLPKLPNPNSEPQFPKDFDNGIL